MHLLDVHRTFDAAASLLAVVAVFLPFLAAWVTSIYENRLLLHFSEGREALTKRNIIGGVMSGVSFPVIAMSFGLAIWGRIVPDDWSRVAQHAVMAPASLALTLAMLLPLRRRMYRNMLADTPQLQPVFLRWVTWLNAVMQTLLIAIFWILLWFRTGLSEQAIN